MLDKGGGWLDNLEIVLENLQGGLYKDQIY
jgi:hypothetical protein